MKLHLLFFILLILLNSLVSAQVDTASTMQRAKERLEKKQADISGILADPSFDFIRSKTEFRKLLQQHASGHSITIVTPSEPGIKIIVKGKIIDNSGASLKNALVYIYQTSTHGWYGSDRPHFLEADGDRRHARLFGYLHTSENGEFEIKTIQPNGYPQSDLPAHIHFEVFGASNRLIKITELLFDDDERLKGDVRKRAEQEGFIIAKPQIAQGSKTFLYTVKL